MFGFKKLTIDAMIGKMVGVAVGKSKCKFIRPGKGDTWYDSCEPSKHGYRLYYKMPDGQSRIMQFGKDVGRE